MGPRLTPCVCTINVLVKFIHRVAYIDVVSVVRPKSSTRLFSSARYYTGTLHHLHAQNSSQHKADKSIQTSSFSRRARWPFQSSVNTPKEGIWASCGGTKVPYSILTRKSYGGRRQKVDESTTGVSEAGRYHEGEPVILEYAPEAIDALAAEPLEDKGYSNSFTEKPARLVKSSRSRTSMKGFALHYSSPPTAPPSQGRGLRKQVPKSPKAQTSGSTTDAQHHFLETEREPWQTQKEALKAKFEDGWNPRKKLSPDALAGIRAIHAQFPEQYTTSVLAEKFEVSPEVIRRILKSRWTPKEEEVLDRQRRWFLRGQKVWSRYAELGLKPPKRWRKLGIGKRSDATAVRGKQQSRDTKITVRSVSQAVPEFDETRSTTSVTMAERIL